MDELQEYLKDVMADVEATWPQYRALSAGITTHPMPFFGNVKHARVLTVGVNPSAGEFKDREWVGAMTSAELKDRLQRYFQLSWPPPHKWFQTWSQALILLGVTYQDGAAHVDLSPRATVSRIKANADRKLFAEMVIRDAQWFYNLLPQCSKVRLLLFAGCVMDKYMECSASKYGFKFEGQITSSGEGRVGFYWLRGPGVELPAFFCSVSPSAWKPEILVQRVEEHRTHLLELLDNQPPHLGM